MIESAQVAGYWDAAAAAFDAEPDHGLGPAATRAAWERLLRRWTPAGACDVLDVGCGTGSLSELLAAAGHRVTGVDLAPRMVGRARAKLAAAGLAAEFLVGDAAAPPTGAAAFDLVLARHLVWTLPDPERALRAWVARLRPGGTLLLIEGRWGEPGRAPEAYVPGADRLPWAAGALPADLVAAVEPLVATVRVESLSEDADLWGRAVSDVRYALIATTPATTAVTAPATASDVGDPR